MKTYGGVRVYLHSSYLGHQLELSAQLNALASAPRQEMRSPEPVWTP
jgi:hypothetical protein